MTDKPGLLDALKAIASECQRWRDEQPTTDGASKGWAQHLQGIAESAIAASPTRDGAEGACPNCGSISPDHSYACYRAPPKPVPSWPQDAPPLRTELLGPDGMSSASEADLKRAYGFDQAAPDAILEAMDNLLEVAVFAKNNSESAPKDYKQTWAAHARKIREAVDAISIALSALVPPADGALEQLARHFETGKFGKDKYLFPNEISSEIREFLASPVVAAEPVAWQNMDDNIHGEKSITVDKGVLEIWLKAGVPIRPLYASPPVRGDRETIARALAITMHSDDVEWRGFLTKADTFIASFPVKSVAPRLPQDTLDRLANAGASAEEIRNALAKAYAILRWNEELDNLSDDMKDDCYGFAGPVQSGAGEREALAPFATFGFDESGNNIRDGLMRDRICDWFGPSDFDAARAAYSRQAPHSSSEDESVNKR